MTGIVSEAGEFSPRELTLATVGQQAVAINHALRDKVVSLDLSRLEHIDVSGIQLLVSISISSSKLNSKFEFTGIKENIVGQFNRCGFQDLSVLSCLSGAR